MLTMTGKRATAVLALGLAVLVPGVFAEQAPAKKSAPLIEDLGNQRYRIGNIEIDKAAGRLSVPGRVLRDQPPIEFLVASRGGHKSYESVLEADATASEFNLACILIGLDASNATTSETAQRGVPWQGDPVQITVSWETDGKSFVVPASSLLLSKNAVLPAAADDWVYVESKILPNGDYLPEAVGTLVGLVQLGQSVIEHSRGINVGNYGGIQVNRELIPAVGETIQLQISRVEGAPPAAGQ